MKLTRDLEEDKMERKALGQGLNELLEAARSEKEIYNPEILLNKIKKSFDLAVRAEDENKVVEAIYYYRYIIKIYDEFIQNNDVKNPIEGFNIIVKAMNNLGGICFDLDRKEESIFWFKRILSIDPDNTLATENLAVLSNK